MLATCLEWEETLGCAPAMTECDLEERAAFEDQEGRLVKVLRGSFEGARCPPVAEALRVCYMEYSPLRLGGDIIFKLLGKVVDGQVKRLDS